MPMDMPTANAALTAPVETNSGRVRGAVEAGISVFKGIPYGAPTGGANRFMAPRPPEPWSGVRDALAYAGHSPQWQAGPTRRPGMATFLGPAADTPAGQASLTFHVSTPRLHNTAR